MRNADWSETDGTGTGRDHDVADRSWTYGHSDGRSLPHGGPITSTELAGYVSRFINAAQQRITGVGAEQYDHGPAGQKFQGLPLGVLCDWALEELQDIAVYAAMLAYRIEVIKKELAA